MTVETEHTELDYGFEEFFGELGGHMTLFIGLNLIGVFEFFFLLLDAVRFYMMHRTPKNTSNVHLTEFKKTPSSVEFTPPDYQLESKL